MRLQTLLRRPAALTAVFAAALALSTTAYAQTAPRVTFTPVTPPAASAPAGASQPAATDSYWELIGGLEFDTDGMLFGFAGPQWNGRLNDDLGLFARAYVNWLQYEFPEAGGTTKVRGPGISTQAGLRFGSERNRFKVGAGPSFRWRDETFTDAAGNEIDVDDDGEDGMEVGLSIGGDAYLNPTDRDNVHAIVNFDTADDYLWSRLGYKRQITNLGWQDQWAHFVGAEGIWQGNDDIKTLMLGGLVEFVHAPSSTALMLRAGLKRSTFEFDDDRSGPYFGVNFYKRLGR